MLILYLSEQLRVGTWLEDDETAVRDGDLLIWLLELLSTGSDRCLQLRSKPFDQSRLRTGDSETSLLQLSLQVGHLHIVHLVEK